MSTNVFFNLSVKDLCASKAFFEKLGYSFNAAFSSETAACLVISDTIFAMLLTEPVFQSFTSMAICDTKSSAEVMIALSMGSREQVDEMIRKALAAGGSTSSKPLDHETMYEHGFRDLDGHHWAYVWMEAPPPQA